MEGAQLLFLNDLLSLLASRPQPPTSRPVASYQQLVGQLWCSMWECGELHCRQRLLWAATALWVIPYSEPPLRCPLWDPHCTPTSTWRWEGQHSKGNLPEALGPEQHRSSPSLRWDTSFHWEGGPGVVVLGIMPEQGWEWQKEHG